MVSKKRFELCEESSKQNQSRMVTLFGQQVYTESFGSGNEQETRNCSNPLIRDIDLQLPANRENVGVFCSQDTIDFSFPLKFKASDTDWFEQRSEKVVISDELGLIDLNKTPVNEPVSNHQQCFFQDLNSPYIEEKEMSFEKRGLDNVHEKDGVASTASCCTAENDSRNEQDSCDAIQMAAECLVHISSQDHDFLNKPEMAIEEPSCSCDSFELHTLGIRETSLEDVCCVSSKAIDELDNLKNKKELGVKVRRGRRRMKDFQKEILPGLASLSRHEIHEDLNILEAVLRSREYKKMQGKTSDDKCRPNSSNSNLVQRYVGRRRRRV